MITKLLRNMAKAAIDWLPHAVLYEAFYQSGRRLGVMSYEVKGVYGSIFGPLYDQTITKSYLRTGNWSPAIANTLTQFFERSDGGTFYDIGANIGLLTLAVSQNSKVQCVAFEPDPVNFRLLWVNVLTNRRDGTVKMINAAVFKESGEIKFTRDPYNSGDHRIAIDGDISVRTMRLDELTPPPRHPLAIKIDTQGAEPAIFEGGRETLAAAELLICEFWPWGIRRAGLSVEPMLEVLPSMFPRAHILRREERGPELSPQQLREEMAALAKDGSQYAAVDIILSR